MSKDERKEMIENIAERFTQMDDVDSPILPDIWQESRRNVRSGSSRERQRLQQHEDDLCLIRRGRFTRNTPKK